MKNVFMVLAVWLLLFPVAVFAQDNGGGGAIDIGLLIANFINSVAVVALAQVLKVYVVPKLSPTILQLIVLILGFALPYLTALLSEALGHAIDLSPIEQVFNGIMTGLGAMGIHSLAKKKLPGQKKRHRAIGK